jgi:uncharacterized protein YbgA (DUF1722 family)/uncharacterized protein YbbK (DUF523 family)
VAGSEGERPRVGVSSCLLGEQVRFNGGHKRFRFLTDELGPYVDWVPYCPEIEIGLGTPREPIRLTADGRLVNRSGTADHTASMKALPLPAAVDGYVFKAKSPSCGVWGIPRYRDDGQASGASGSGLYAGRVAVADPLLAVEDEGRLNDAGRREGFVERVFAAARLRALLSGSREPRDLVAFHARHKLQLLAHDPVRYRSAGRVVAGAASPGTAAAYRELFLAAMASRPTRGRHANALLHAYSRIGRSLAPALASDLVGRIDAYRRGEVPLSVPVALLAHYASGGDLPWLAEQTYLAPFPAGLRLRHTV